MHLAKGQTVGGDRARLHKRAYKSVAGLLKGMDSQACLSGREPI
jgi:hypothetical protein